MINSQMSNVYHSEDEEFEQHIDDAKGQENKVKAYMSDDSNEFEYNREIDNKSDNYFLKHTEDIYDSDKEESETPVIQKREVPINITDKKKNLVNNKQQARHASISAQAKSKPSAKSSSINTGKYLNPGVTGNSSNQHHTALTFCSILKMKKEQETKSNYIIK